jgi:hypothetical protein
VPDLKKNLLSVDIFLDLTPGKRPNIGRDNQASFAIVVELLVKNGTSLVSQLQYFRCHRAENEEYVVGIYRCLSLSGARILNLLLTKHY